MSKLFLALLLTIATPWAFANERENQIEKVLRLTAEYTQLSDQLAEAKSSQKKRKIGFYVSLSVAVGLGFLGHRLQVTKGEGGYSGMGNDIGTWFSYRGAVVATAVAGYQGFRVYIKDPRVIDQLSLHVKKKLEELQEAKKMELLIQEKTE
ncbi:MAG: hypothetical protein ACK5V3_11145 [Bdellovibrionales bacterium]